MKKILTAAFLLIALSATAQDLNRQVEVTKAYAPEGITAEKLPFAPQLEDSVPLRPEGEYRILPVAWQTDFHVAPITAAGVDARLVDRQPLLYVQAGGGVPLSSQVDAHLHRVFADSYAGAWLRHRANLADRDNDMDKAVDATATTNALGGYVHTDLAGDHLGLLFEAQAGWDYHTRYGQALDLAYPEPVPPGKPAINSVGQAGAKLSLGNDFDSLGRFTWRLSIAGTLSDRFDNGQEELHATLSLGYRIRASRIALAGWRDIYNGLGATHELFLYKSTLLGLRPTYEFAREQFEFLVGATIVAEQIKELDALRDDNLYVFPRLRVEWNPASGAFVPFFDVDGRVISNDYRSLLVRNPYLRSGEVGTYNTAVWQAQAGLAGSISGALAWKLYGGMALYNHFTHFGYIYEAPDAAGFALEMQDVSQWWIGAELSARIAGNVELRLDARRNFNHSEGWGVDMVGGGDGPDKVGEIPEWAANFSARYNYRNRFSIAAGVDAVGERYFFRSNFADAERKADPQADLWLRTDVRLSERFGLWAEGRNLLEQELYPHYHYRMPRVVSLGVSFKLQ